MDAIHIGIDVSKDRLDVASYPRGETFCTTRKSRDLDELVGRLVVLKPALVAVEATGGYERVVAAAIAAAGLPLAVVNPAQVRHFALALGQRAKTDPIDAGVIAHFAAATKAEPRTVPDEEAQLFGDLVARRGQITEMIGAERQRQKRAVNRRLRKSTERLIAALEKELASVDDEIDTMVKGSPVWREKEDLLASVPGIGKKTARVLLAEMPELGTLGKKSVACLAGLAPFVRTSGKWKGKSMIGGGRASVRSALFVCAMVASRHNPQLKTFHQRLIAAGKSRMVALIAVARKLLTILNAILRDKRPWNPDACPA